MFFFPSLNFVWLFACTLCESVCESPIWKELLCSVCMYFFFFVLFLFVYLFFCFFCGDGLLPHQCCNFKPGCCGGGDGGRERGASAVYVEALHCLMLNTSFCTSCFRGLCVSVCVCVTLGGWAGGRADGWGQLARHIPHTLGALVDMCW